MDNKTAPIRLFFWNMETNEPIRGDYIKVRFRKLNDDGEYAPVIPHAVGVKVEGFQVLAGVDIKKNPKKENDNG